MKKKAIGKKLGAGILATAMVITVMPVDYAHACVGFRPGDANNGVVTTNTPTTAANTELKWEKALGSGWSANPTPPTVVGDYVYTAAGTKLYRLDKATGEKLAPVDGFTLDGDVGFTTNPMAYADGSLYIQISNGRIEKVDVSNPDSFTRDWTWSDPSVKGQTISPIIYEKGKIYTGMWNGENRPGAYVCINSATGQAEWIHQNPAAGYYWAGAYVDDSGAYFGSDNGELMQVKTVVSPSGEKNVEKRTIKLSNSKAKNKTQVRSTIVKYGEYLYFTTKDGYLYKINSSEFDSMSNGGTKGYGKDKIDVAMVKIGTMATGTPSIADNVVYIGAANGSQFSATAGHMFKTIDADSLKPIKNLVSPGYPQAAPLVKDGNNENYAYFTYNASPGGMKVFKADDLGRIDEASYQDLFVPDASGQQYCICPIMTDDTGNLYYKNDSGKMFCLANLDVTATTGLTNMTVSTGNLSPAFSATERNYNLTLPVGTSAFDLTLTLEEGATATVDGTAYSGVANISLDTALSKDINVVVRKGAATTTYAIHVTKEENAVINSLVITDSEGVVQTLTPSFASDVLTYESQWTDPIRIYTKANGDSYINPNYVEKLFITVDVPADVDEIGAKISKGGTADVEEPVAVGNGKYKFAVTFTGNTIIADAPENYTPMMLKQMDKVALDTELSITVNKHTVYKIKLPRNILNQ